MSQKIARPLLQQPQKEFRLTQGSATFPLRGPHPDQTKQGSSGPPQSLKRGQLQTFRHFSAQLLMKTEKYKNKISERSSPEYKVHFGGIIGVDQQNKKIHVII